MKKKTHLFAAVLAIFMLILSVTARAEEASEPEAAEVLSVPTSVMQVAEITETITNNCLLTLPERHADKAYRVLDAYVESYLTFIAGDSIFIEMPEAAQGLYLEWFAQTSAYHIEELDAQGSEIRTHSAQPYINAYYNLDPNTRALQIIITDDCLLSSLRLYSADVALPDDVQLWQDPYQSVDLMFLAATPEAALEDFFAALSYYTIEHGLQTALVCMSADSRTAQNELLGALWSLGVKHYPHFGGFFTWNPTSYMMVNQEWKLPETPNYIERMLNTLTPRVLVTHAENPADRIQARFYTTEQLLSLLSSKKNPLANAGIQKIYLCADSGTVLDLDKPLLNFDGVSVREVVQRIAFSQFHSLHDRPLGITARSCFSLSYSTVGEDVLKNDLLENIPVDSLFNFVSPTPVPTETPAPIPTSTPVPVSTPVPTVDPQIDFNPKPSSLSPHLYWILPVFGLALTTIVFCVKRRKPIKRKKLPAFILLTLLPLFIGLILSAALYLWSFLSEDNTSPASESTPAITIAPTPAPIIEEQITPMPDPETTATQEPVIDVDAQYYRQKDEPVEVIIVDAEKGCWEYRTDTLSIFINRIITTYTTRQGHTFPQVYFVAEIRMRNVNSFRTAQAAERRNGLYAVLPYKLARDNHGVLLITGDNLIMNDKSYKGILIRGGKFIGDFKYADTMAMYPDMTMRVYRPGETSYQELLADGVRDAISFGPTLMRKGIVDIGITRYRDIGDERNPRVGLGMVKPGHFVAIVADGRQKDDYSHGMGLPEFAELFLKYGCTEVYNLDGGVSACMIFMGEQLNRHSNRVDGGYTQSFQRRVPDGLVWGYSTQVPSSDDPVYNKGTNKDRQNILPTPTVAP